MNINQAGLDLIKEFEGFRANAYRCSAGKWTIGYGTTESAGVGIVPVPGMSVTQNEAQWYLERTLRKFGDQIKPLITGTINENEWAAFLSLAYNIGPTAFKRSSALRHFNARDKEQSAKSILLWNKETVNGKKVVSRGLARRRAAERALFLTPCVDEPATPITDTPRGGIVAALVALIAAIAAIFGRKK